MNTDLIKPHTRVALIYSDWKEEARADYYFKIEQNKRIKERLKLQIELLKKELKNAKLEIKNIKKAKLDLSKEKYSNYIEYNKKEAEKDGLEFKIIKAEEWGK